MPSTTNFRFGDVVLVHFPFTDLTTTKKRPATVVSSDHYNRDKLDVILMAITSQMAHLGRLGVVEVSDWKRSGLLGPSVLKPILASIQKDKVIKTLGRLDATTRGDVQTTLGEILG